MVPRRHQDAGTDLLAPTALLPRRPAHHALAPTVVRAPASGRVRTFGAADLLGVQRTVGNRAVTQLLASRGGPLTVQRGDEGPPTATATKERPASAQNISSGVLVKGQPAVAGPITAIALWKQNGVRTHKLHWWILFGFSTAGGTKWFHSTSSWPTGPG